MKRGVYENNPIDAHDELRYAWGLIPPRYPVPSVPKCPWCGEPEVYDEHGRSLPSVCSFNGTGRWCPMMCFG